jgi:hypothetical protein
MKSSKAIKIYTLIIGLAILAACRPASERAPEKARFYDLRSFLNAEAGRYAADRYEMITQAGVNGHYEADTLLSADSSAWLRIFKLLIESDINKAALHGRYHMESREAAGGKITRYEALDEGLSVRQLSVEERDGNIWRISLLLDEKNPVYHSRQKILYVRDSLYRIEAGQRVMLASPDSFYVEVLIKAPAR